MRSHDAGNGISTYWRLLFNGLGNGCKRLGCFIEHGRLGNCLVLSLCNPNRVRIRWPDRGWRFAIADNAVL